MERAIAELRERGNATPAEFDQAEVNACIDRLSVTTFLRHGRYINRVAKMLHALNIIEENPFSSICNWSNDAEKALRSTRASRRRDVWDDKIFALFNSAVYQGGCEDPGEPLFWAPLIARFEGMREEEILQLGVDDFGVEDGIDYVSIHDGGKNRVKSEAAIRKIPVHPALVKLGLLDLVALRRAQGQSRLFPHLPRGETKGTFTEVFTKRFGYYRKTNNCYWPGRDFHSFRTTVNGDLMNSTCKDSIRRRLMGHEPLDAGEKHYAQGLKISTLYEDICKIEVDISMIKSPFDKGKTETEMNASTAGLRLVASNG
ncbi:MAG: site-specific integrase [Maritimibacter sp.]|nr:site-specific integrase [Maritimibacter sp.]